MPGATRRFRFAGETIAFAKSAGAARDFLCCAAFGIDFLAALVEK